MIGWVNNMKNNDEVFENDEEFIELTEEEMKKIEGGKAFLFKIQSKGSGNKVNLREHATTKSRKLCSLSNGTLVEWRDAYYNGTAYWCKVKVKSTGQIGWVCKSRIVPAGQTSNYGG